MLDAGRAGRAGRSGRAGRAGRASVIVDMEANFETHVEFIDLGDLESSGSIDLYSLIEFRRQARS